MSSIFSYRFQIQKSGKQYRDLLLLFVATPNLDEDDLAVEVERQIDSKLIPDEVIVLVPEPRIVGTLGRFAQSPILSSVLSRLGNQCVVAVVGYGRHAELVSFEVLSPLPTSVTKPSVDWESLKRRALTEIFRHNGAFVESNESFHFENPSRRHTQRFIKLSNILVRGAEIAFIAFCALRFVPEDTVLAYIDTPSLYAVVAAINEQLRVFGSERTILADNFKSYDGIETYAFRRVSEAMGIISASSTGSMAQVLASKAGFSHDRVFHVLYLGKQEGSQRIVCNLSKDRKNPDGYPKDYAYAVAADNCMLCREGSQPISLQGDQFNIAGPQLPTFLINRDHGPRGTKDLFNRLSCRSIFGLGLGRVQDSQPRQFFVDTEYLFRSEPFAEHLNYLLDTIVPARTQYVVHVDEYSRELAQLVADRVVGSPAILPGDQVDDIDPSNEQPIAVVAAVIESGRSLQDVSRDIRSISPKCPIVYVVGLAKVTGEQYRDRLRSTLTESSRHVRHVYAELEHLILPPSQNEHAWTAELELFRDPTFLEVLDDLEKQAIDARRVVLEVTSAPLVNNLFLANTPELVPALQANFVFWHPGYKKASQADVYFTIASILQELRRTGKISSNPFQSTLLAPTNFGRFNDGVVQASLLRAANTSETNYAGSAAESKEMSNLIQRIVSNADKRRGEAAAEFLLAIGTRRLTLQDGDLWQVIRAATPETPILSALLKACRLKFRA